MIFIVGIGRKSDVIAEVLCAPSDMGTLPGAIFRSFQYAGFQCSSIPTMIACGTVLKMRRKRERACGSRLR